MSSRARVQAVVALGLAAALWGGWALFGTPVRVRWLVASGAPPAEEKAAGVAYEAILALGFPAKPTLVSILEDGSSSRARKTWVAAILLREPFFARTEVERALASSNPRTARGAAAALVERMSPEPGTPKAGQAVGTVKTPRVDPDPWDASPAVPVLRAWLADKGDREAGLAARLLGDLPPATKGAKEALLAVLEEVPAFASKATPPEARERKAAIVTALRALLAWAPSDPDVAARVAPLLAKFAEPGAEDLDWDLVAAGLDLLESARGRDVDPALMEALSRHPSVPLRMKVAGALETFPGTAPSRILERLCGDEAPTARRSAVRSLRTRKDRVLLDLLPYLVEDSLVWVRSEALRSVGELTGVDPEGCRAAVPLLVSCFETPWQGLVPDPTTSAAQSWDAARIDVIEACALALNRVTGRAYGFRPEELLDWKRRAQVASTLASDEALRAKAVAQWRETYAPWPDEKRIVPLVKRLDDRDPDCVLRAMRELKRITGDSTGFPADALERSGDDTPNRNVIRVWAKSPEKAKCLEHWRRAR